MERLPEFLAIKADIASRYQQFCAANGLTFVCARAGTTPNFWLNALVMNSVQERDEFLTFTNAQGVMTRPIWKLMTTLPMFAHCQHDGLENSHWLEERVVNIPSSVPDGALKDFAK